MSKGISYATAQKMVRDTFNLTPMRGATIDDQVAVIIGAACRARDPELLSSAWRQDGLNTSLTAEEFAARLASVKALFFHVMGGGK